MSHRPLNPLEVEDRALAPLGRELLPQALRLRIGEPWRTRAWSVNLQETSVKIGAQAEAS